MSTLFSAVRRGRPFAFPCPVELVSRPLLGLLFALAVVSHWSDSAFAQRGGGQQAAEGLPRVPPCPDGTPEELMAFVKQLQQPQGQPTSREEMMRYYGEVANVTLEAAEKILAQSQAGDENAVAGARMKLESLMMLSQLGNETANGDLAAYAESLANSPSPELANEARRISLLVAVRQVMASQGQGGAEVLQRIQAMLTENPDDVQTAQMAMQVASMFENMPGGGDLAKQAYATLSTTLAKSSDERVRQMGAKFEGVLRRLDLPGNPIEISGTLLDGTPFDQKSLDGQVVLVDFWATWCGPCIAELPNVLAEYEKYHDRGFEVIGISLDDDKQALVSFVNKRKIPWPILFEESENSGWNHPMATKYGINGIPSVILVGRDGKVVSMDVRGEKLGQALEKLFAK